MTSEMFLSGSVVTVTGGTGSFGQTLVREALRQGASQVRVFSRDEAKQDSLRNELRDGRVKFYLGDTRDSESVAMALRGSRYVFHAAALKQVPSAEFFPWEAVKTNIHGSENVIREAVSARVQTIVCLSTDKAVYPINAMGMSKSLMEKTAVALARDNVDAETNICVTRYGNVLYSRGSVVPLFISQLRRGKPLTLTDPRMTRFLMTLEQSVDLVLHAMQNGGSGDLFVRKAPASTLGDLATALSELFSQQTEWENMGFRHGEKLFESLLSAEERSVAEDEGAYFRVPLDNRDLNYEVFFEEGRVRPDEVGAYTSHNTEQLSVEQVKSLLLTLPEIQKELG